MSQLPNIWDVIERIGATLELTDHELAEMLELTDREFEKYKFNKKDLLMTKVFLLSDRLNVGFNSIVTGKIDYQALSQHHHGNQNFLPERYSTAAFSRRRTPVMFLNYIEMMFGWQQRLQILKHFQLNEAVFSDLDAPISFSFATDLCEYLQRYKMSQTAVSQIGMQSFLSTNTTQVKKELQECKTLTELYEKMCVDLVPKYFEKNFHYKIIRSSKTHCAFSATPNPDFVDMIGEYQIGNATTAAARIGIAAAYPMILGLPAAEVKQTASIYEGDSEIRYEVDFSHSAKVMENTTYN